MIFCFCCWFVHCFFSFPHCVFPFILYTSFILYDFSLFIHLSFVIWSFALVVGSILVVVLHLGYHFACSLILETHSLLRRLCPGGF